MKLSTRTRYGIRAILEVAANHGEGPLQTKVIAQRQDISMKYLEQLMAILKSAGLVRSFRGAKGGYVLAKAPKEVRISEVFDVLEGSSSITVGCVEDDSFCAKAADCVARGLWAEVEQAVRNVLQSVTLQDLVDRTKNKKTVNYQI
jgi:Rrf2 family protein